MWVIIEHINETTVKVIGRYRIEYINTLDLKTNQKVIHEDYLDCFNVVPNAYLDDDNIPF